MGDVSVDSGQTTSVNGTITSAGYVELGGWDSHTGESSIIIAGGDLLATGDSMLVLRGGVTAEDSWTQAGNGLSFTGTFIVSGDALFSVTDSGDAGMQINGAIRAEGDVELSVMGKGTAGLVVNDVINAEGNVDMMVFDNGGLTVNDVVNAEYGDIFLMSAGGGNTTVTGTVNAEYGEIMMVAPAGDTSIMGDITALQGIIEIDGMYVTAGDGGYIEAGEGLYTSSAGATVTAGATLYSHESIFMVVGASSDLRETTFGWGTDPLFADSGFWGASSDINTGAGDEYVMPDGGTVFAYSLSDELVVNLPVF